MLIFKAYICMNRTVEGKLVEGNEIFTCCSNSINEEKYCVNLALISHFVIISIIKITSKIKVKNNK